MRIALLVGRGAARAGGGHASGGMHGRRELGRERAPARPAARTRTSRCRWTAARSSRPCRRDGGRVDRWKHLNAPLRRAAGGARRRDDRPVRGRARARARRDAGRVLPSRRTGCSCCSATTFEELGRFSFPGPLHRGGDLAARPLRLPAPLHRARCAIPQRSELVVLDRGEPGAPRAITGEPTGSPGVARVRRPLGVHALPARRLVGGGPRHRHAGHAALGGPRLRGNDLVRLRLDGRLLRARHRL